MKNILLNITKALQKNYNSIKLKKVKNTLSSE